MSIRADLVAGLDCGIQTGVAVYSRSRKALVFCESMNFWDTFEIFVGTYPRIVRPQDAPARDYAASLDWMSVAGRRSPSSLRTTEEHRGVEIVIEIHGAGALYARTDAAVARGTKGRDKFAANVGSNRREAVLLADGLERLGYNVRRVRPINAKKWDAAEFMRFTKWPKGENEHVRDAARLVWGL